MTKAKSKNQQLEGEDNLWKSEPFQGYLKVGDNYVRSDPVLVLGIWEDREDIIKVWKAFAGQQS